MNLKLFENYKLLRNFFNLLRYFSIFVCIFDLLTELVFSGSSKYCENVEKIKISRKIFRTTKISSMNEEIVSFTPNKSLTYMSGIQEEAIAKVLESFGMKLRLHRNPSSPSATTRKLSSFLSKGTNALCTQLLVFLEERREIGSNSRDLRRRKSWRHTREGEKGAYSSENTRGERMKEGWTYLGKKEGRRWLKA